MVTGIITLILAYLLGSFPTALIIGRLAAGVDIRTIGDGNMGARNIACTIGLRYGVLVTAIDLLKGASAVLLARAFGLELSWQAATGFCAALGHDYPIFAGLRGGQGLAAIVGALWVLLPLETTIGFIIYLAVLISVRNSDLGASLGLGLLVLLEFLSHKPAGLILFTVLLILTIPAKKLLDAPRRAEIARSQKENHNHAG